MYQIDIETTKHADILKFRSNKPLLKSDESIEVSRDTDLIEYPLLQHLMTFPFVLGLYVTQDFVAIHKEDSVESALIQKALSENIESLLNKGVRIKNEADRHPTTIYVESTPNADVYKFVANRPLVQGQYEIVRGDDASNVPLAVLLFENNFVENVFIKENYVALTKTPDVKWEEVQSDIREQIHQYLQKGNSVVIDDQPIEEKKAVPSKPLSGIDQQIANTLKEYIEPAVSADGGNIKFEFYNNDTKEVFVTLHGACNGCPSSTMTLKNAVEQTLKNVIGEALIGNVVAR